MRNKTPITSVENLESVLEILKVLIREGIQQAQGYPGGPIQRRAQETEETIEEQGWLARIVHLLHGKDNDTQFKVGSTVSDQESVNANKHRSFFNRRARHSRKATSASSTPHQRSSQHPSSLHGGTRSASTSTITGSHSRRRYTSSCIIRSPPCTAVLQAPPTYHCASLLLVGKSLIRTTLKKWRMSTSRKLLPSTKKRSVIRGHNSRLCASLLVDCTQHGTLVKRTTTHSSQNARCTEANCSRSRTSAVRSTLRVTCGGRQS